MTLKLKILLLASLMSLGVGLGTAFMFSQEWAKLAKTYALANLDLNLSGVSGDAWAFSFDAKGSVSWTTPKAASAHGEEDLQNKVIEQVRATRLSQGIFEMKDEAQMISFRRSPDGVTHVSGVASEANFAELTPWAAPFLMIVAVALLLSFVISLLIANRLNSGYLLLERALENIGAGRLTQLELPQTSDPSLKRLSHAVDSTAKLLLAKDSKIAEVSNLANEDPMTGVPNYRAFEDFIEGLMSGIFVPDTVPILGIIDLDHFKKINDSHGHQVGDYVLRETTKIIQDCIRYDSDNTNRSPDFFGRYRGEEFVIIFTSVKRDSVHIAAQRILQRIKSTTLNIPSEISESKKSFVLNISASIGIAQWSGKTFSKEDWIKEADQALYDAKKSGRGRLVQLKPERKEWT